MSALALEHSRQKPRSGLSAPPKQLVRSTSQILAQNHHPLSRQRSLDQGSSSTFTSLEPSAKRQRTDPNLGGAFSGRRDPVSVNTPAFVQSLQLERGGNTTTSQGSRRGLLSSNFKAPPFPNRPGRLAAKSLTTNSSRTNAKTKECVQSKPYALEAPKVVPRYGNGGKMSSKNSILVID